MNGARVIVYDTEIKRAIPDSKSQPDPALRYCKGWGDRIGMGISVICAIDVESGIPRVFLDDNLQAFAAWTEGAVLAGHTNDSFDNELVKAHGLYRAAGSYDLLTRLRVAAGEPATYVRGVTKAGRKVNDCARVNLGGLQKSDDGANAPRLYQEGKIGELVDYCLRDVSIEYQLFLRRGAFVDPVTGRVFDLGEPVAA